MSTPEAGPWSAHLVRRGGGFGVRVEVDATFGSREAATEAGAALLGQLDVRLEAFGRRLREEAEPPPEAAELVPQVAALLAPHFAEPS